MTRTYGTYSCQCGAIVSLCGMAYRSHERGKRHTAALAALKAVPNARLIAAAPDLLAALAALKDHVASEMTFTGDGAGWQPDDLPLAQLVTNAEDAIAKATAQP